MIKPLLVGGKEYSLDDVNLDRADAELVETIAREVLGGVCDKHAVYLDRCNFFAEGGIDFLVNATSRREGVVNPRIEADDRNPFNQHYWLAFDLALSYIIFYS